MESDDDELLSAPLYDLPPMVSYDSMPEGQLVLSAVGDSSSMPSSVAAAGARAPQPAQQPSQPSAQLQYQQRQPPPQPRPIDPAVVRSWTVIYPRYLEEGITQAQGRRLSKKAVAGCA
jgi:hypothetical protein